MKLKLPGFKKAEVATDKEQAWLETSLERIVEDTKQLRHLLKEETALLKKMQLRDVKELLETKLKLIRRLEIQRQLVIDNPDLIGTLSERQKKDIAELQAETDAVMQENFREVRKAKEINERVMQMIAKAMIQREVNVKGYGKQGVQASASASRDASALALNQMI